MDEAVAHKDNEPVFYMRDLFFTRLVVDVLDYVVFGNHLHYTVYYAATSKLKFPLIILLKYYVDIKCNSPNSDLYNFIIYIFLANFY